MNLSSSILMDGEQIMIRENNRIDTYTGKGSNIAFVVENGDVGDDIINDFGSTDALITGKKIFDGNKDGFIGFGSNGLLDIDRISARKAGNDQLKITNNGHSVNELRYLGEFEGQHAYAVASTHDGFIYVANQGIGGAIGTSYGIEGTIGDDKLTTKGQALLIDNALGLRTGTDVVTDAGPGAKFVTTAKLSGDDGFGLIQGRHIGNDFLFAVQGPNGNFLGTVTLTDSHASYLQLVDTTTVGDQSFYTYQTIES